ncbi:MAG TPA: hypothetical protein VJU77_03085 [Chthoniobacterales bacterium]|nr:hypothetical protein [Chthoniobacterales bacterium]
MRKIGSLIFLLFPGLFALALGQTPQAKPLPAEELEKYEDAPRFIFRTDTSPRRISVHGPFASHQVNLDGKEMNIVGDAANEPSITVDPSNPARMSIGWRQFDSVASNFRKGGWAYTANGGISWSFPGSLSSVFRSDPVLFSTDTGAFFYLSLLSGFQDDIWRSLNSGQTWTRLTTNATGGDKQWLTIDNTTSSGRGFQYQSWSTGGNNYGGRQFSRSIDGGVTWLDPVFIPNSPSWGTLDVASNGDLFIGGVNLANGSFWCVRSTDARNSKAVPTFDRSTAVNMGGGVGFSQAINPEGLVGQVFLAVDRSGTSTNNNIYMAASLLTGQSASDVMFAKSTDGGQTFSAPRRINDDPVNPNKWHWLGTLSVAPNGRIDAVWLDTRNAANNTDSQLFYSFSLDGGDTWSANVAVSEPFNPFLGYPNQNKMGDYITIVSDNTGGNVAYAATFNLEEDIYYVRVDPVRGSPPGNGRIAFESSRLSGDTARDIFVMEADGANATNLTSNQSYNLFADWSPDGTKIAFSSDRSGDFEIYLMNADGSNPVRLTNNPAEDQRPRWSPDGTKFAFYSDRDNNAGHFEVYVMNVDGSQPTRLTNTMGVDYEPTWSPDGRKIVFTSFRDGNSEVYVMDADGSNQMNLTNRPGGGDRQPAWSPDGSKIAFSSTRSGSGVFVMNPDGSNVVQLTQSGSNFADGDAAWSPDSTRIAFDRTLGGLGGNGETFVMNADGSNQTNITNDPALDIRPSWQRIASSPTPTPTPTPTATATPVPTTTPQPSTTPTPTPSGTPGPASQAVNLSTRMRVLTDDNVGIGGFIITGTGTKHVLIRAVGPSLSQFGVPDPLADPVLELHGPGAFVTVNNDNWMDDPVQRALIEGTGLQPTNNVESAIYATLDPGEYTAIISGKNNTTGVGLIEVYDVAAGDASKLANISTRAFVSTGNDIVIAGFILGGNNSGSDRVIIRGIGPSLASSGVTNPLANPTLELRDSNGSLIFANNDWQENSDQAAQLISAGLAPTNNLESGIAATLPPGLYTALLAGLNNGTGVGLVEVYDRGP